MDGQKKSRPSTKILNFLIVATIFGLPISVDNYTMVQQEALRIHFSKNSPPLAILEDEQNISILQKEITPTRETNPEAEKINLATTAKKKSKMMAKVAREIAAKFAQEQKSIAQTKSQINYETRDLSGLTLNKNSVNIRLLKKEMGIQTQPEKIKLATNEDFQSKHEAQEVEETRVPENFNEETTEEPREIATTSLSADQVAANFARNALVEPKTDNDIARHLDVGSGKVIFHYAQNESAAIGASHVPPPLTKVPIQKKTDKTNTNEAQTIAQNSTPKRPSLLSNPPSQALLAGALEFSGGLAYTGVQKISVYREIAGSKTNDGQAILNQGKFEIYVENPSKGTIVADMYENNQVVGHGEILLAEALRDASVTGQLRNLKMILYPRANTIKSSTMSAYAELEKTNKLDAVTSINDVMTTKDNLLPSVVLMRASKENYWGSLSLGTSLKAFRNILYPDRNIQALEEILGVSQSKKETGIIRGVVKILGKPISGATVEFAPTLLQSDEIQKAIYFNSFIPDKNLNQTSENGEFAFIGVNSGVYVLRATYQGKVLSPQVVPVENGVVTSANFNVEKPSLAQAYVYNMQNGEETTADIGFLGADRYTRVLGSKLVSFSGADGVQFLEARAENEAYYTTRVTINKAEKEILVPMIPQNWIAVVTSGLKIDSSPDSAMIVGTALETPYQAELDPKAYNDETRIIYYNRAGYPVIGATSTPVGGGFIALNVNPGMRSIFVTYQGQKAKKIITMAADNTAVNVFVSKH